MANLVKDESVYGFLAEYFDNQAQMKRRYQLKYYVESNQIEMIDDKTRKLFLKRSAAPPELTMKELFLGSKIQILGRSLDLVDYLDPATRSKLEAQRQKTVAIITPDAHHHIGKLIEALYRNGFTISRLQMLLLHAEEAGELYRKHKGTPFFDNIVKHMSSGTICVVELVADDSINKLLQLIGPLRARYGAGDLEVAIEGATTANEVKDWQDFFFSRKHAPTATFENCTCCVIQPHIVKEGKAGQIIDMIQQQSFDISAMQMFTLTKLQATEFLEVYQGVVPQFHEMVAQLSTGPCIALEIRAMDAVKSFREAVGPWDIDVAKDLRAHTMRAKFGTDRVKNAIHCTDLPDDAVLEVQYFFDVLQQQQRV